MKKFLSVKIAIALALISSLLIVACLKEQVSSTTNTDKVDFVDFVKSKNPNIKITPTKHASQRTNECKSTRGNDLQCLTKDVEMVVSVPGIEGLPACDDVTVNFTVTECAATDGSGIFVDYENFTFRTCQEVMNALQPDPNGPALPNLEELYEKYAYLVSINAEYIYTGFIVQFYGVNLIVESNFYNDLCYYISIDNIPEIGLDFVKIPCGSACCLRTRKFYSNGPDVPPLSTAPIYTKIGECEPSGDVIGLGSCERTCGPLE